MDPATGPPFYLLFSLPADAEESKLKEIIQQQILSVAARHPTLEAGDLFLIHEEEMLTRFSADRFYRGLRRRPSLTRMLLSLNSPGGLPSAAYFISKLCRRHSTGEFHVAIPRRAKSAATLICCGADTLHMGGLSELGPIDPQIRGVPLLALKHSVEHIAQLASSNLGASRMFSDYLAGALRIESIGYFERVAESLVHYATKLLKTRTKRPQANPSEAETLARRLVYDYKDHGFVIDTDEAIDVFGKEYIAQETPEYAAANELYESLELMGYILEQRFGRRISYIGDLSVESCWLHRVEPSDVSAGARSTE